jgi:hypothetical protein
MAEQLTWRSTAVATISRTFPRALVLFVPLLVCCGQDATPIPDTTAVNPTLRSPAAAGARGARPSDTLRPSRSFGGPDTWGYPGRVLLVGDTVFVYDLYASTIIGVVDRRTGAVVGRFGRKGGGPGEYRTISDIFPAPSAPGHFWILDAGARRLSLYGPPSPGSHTPHLLDTRLVELDGRAEGVRFTPQGLVAAGIFSHSPVLVADSTAKQVARRIGRYPLHAPGDSSSTRLSINRPGVAFHPDLTKVAIAYRHNNVVQLYDLLQGEGISYAGPEPFEVPRGPEIMDLNPRRLAYTYVRATRRYVYAMFCGCSLSRDRSERTTRLHVFTWAGELVAILPINPSSKVFDVSQDDRFLYTVTNTPYPQVLETALPPDLSTSNTVP